MQAGVPGKKKKEEPKLSKIEERLNKMETFFDTQRYVVIDNGTGFLKAGFSGQDLPRVVMPTVSGIQEKALEQPVGYDQQIKKVALFGKQAIEHRESSKLTYPISRGVIQDWDTMEHIYNHIYDTELLVDKKTDVLIAECPIDKKQNRKELAALFFEKYNVNSLAIMNSAVLSLFSTGRTTGLIVEVGEGVSYVVPIFEGFGLQHGIEELPLGGQDITDQLILNLQQSGLDIKTEQTECGREIKEKMCSVAQDFEMALKRPDPLSEEERSYELPDGQIIQVPHTARFHASEILFDPSIRGLENSNIANSVIDSIEKCSKDIKPELYERVVLTGGSSLLRGYKDRMIKELKQIGPPGEINLHSDSHAKYAAWIGGSMLASLSTFKNMVITKTQYDDIGEGNAREDLILKQAF